MTLSLEDGKTIETVFYGQEHRMIMRQVQSFTNIVEKDGIRYIRQQVELFDAADNLVSKGSCHIQCYNEMSLFHLKLLIPQWINEEGDPHIDIPVQKGLEYPLAMEVGDQLPEGEFSLEIKTGQTSEKVFLKISDRKVEARETILCDAEQFDCFRISCTVGVSYTEAISGPPIRPIKMEEWFVPGVGVLKAQTPDGSCLEIKTLLL
jgi:hypothetical protein